MDSQSLQKTQTQMQSQLTDTETLIKDFFFILFSPNPIKESVRVIVDDGTYKLYMKASKFESIIKDTLGEKAALYVRNLCGTYGGFFLVDRIKAQITQLHLKNEKQLLNVKQLHNDIESLKKDSSKEDIVRERFLAALQAGTDSAVRRGLAGTKPTYNRFSSTIIYGSNVSFSKDYRPY